MSVTQSCIMRKPLLCAILILIVIVPYPIQSIQAQTDSRPFIKRVIFEGGDFSSAEIAEKADIYMGHVEQGWRVAQIKARNPDVITLLYRNVRSIRSWDPEWSTAVYNNWILKDAYGTYIYSSLYREYIVDKGNSNYQQWVANWLKDKVEQYGYDGVYLDCTVYPTIGENCWGTNWKAGTAGPPINPRTGLLYTDDDQKAAEISLLGTIKDILGKKIVCNGIYHGERFFQREYDDILLGARYDIDGILSEGWLSDINYPDWYSESKWKDSIDFVVWLENNFLGGGRMFHPIAMSAEHIPNQGPSLPAGCTSQQYVTYNFASLLLGATRSDTHYINFGYYQSNYLDSLFEVDPGSPLGSYYIVSGTHVYARDFSNIKVLVNPTYQGYSVQLTGSYETIDGTPVGSSIWMSPHTGMILIKP